MVRSAMLARGLGEEAGFRWRGREVTRLEGLSDAVFGFAVTLLVVSLEVPRTFGEMLEAMRGFPADVRTALLNVGVGVLSVCVALFGRGPLSLAAAGFTYALLGPVMTLDGISRGRRRRRLLAAEEPAADHAGAAVLAG